MDWALRIVFHCGVFGFGLCVCEKQWKHCLSTNVENCQSWVIIFNYSFYFILFYTTGVVLIKTGGILNHHCWIWYTFSVKTNILRSEVEIKVTGLFLLPEYILYISRALLKQFDDIFRISLLNVFRLLLQFHPSAICSIIITLPHISAPHFFINKLDQT